MKNDHVVGEISKGRKEKEPNNIAVAVSNEDVLSNLRPLKEAQDGVIFIGNSKPTQGNSSVGRELKDITTTVAEAKFQKKT